MQQLLLMYYQYWSWYAHDVDTYYVTIIGT